MTRATPRAGEVERVIRRITELLPPVLPNALLGLYLYGSLVTGDFHPHRSDIDLLAVLTADPEDSDLQRLREVHARLESEEPDWQGRVEVAYISQPALRSFRTTERPMIRISPGEPLHFVVASRHYLLGWYMARHSGVSLFGPAASQVIPSIEHAEFLEVVREHARQWKVWVHDTGGPGGQAYAVLTVCRAWYTSVTGEQVSKRRAALWTRDRIPEWGGLIRWALEWDGAADAGSDHFAEVIQFVGMVSDRIESEHGT